MPDITYDGDIEISESKTAFQSETAGPAFTVGAVLSRTWTVLFKNPLVFFGLTIFVFALAQLAEHGIVFLWSGISEGYFIFLRLLVVMVLGLWVGGAAAYGVYQSLKGNRTSLADSLLHGTRRIVPLFFVGTLVGICTALGSIMFVIPGIILHCTWVAAVPACVVERLGATDSLLRSEKLTRGCRMKIFGIALVIDIVTQIFTRTMAFIMGVDIETLGSLFIPDLIARLLPTTFDFAIAAVIYYSLRESKEGVSVDQLANVFD